MKRPQWDRRKGRPEPIAALNRIPELENGEPLVDLREACPSIVIYRPSVIPYLRETVALKLEAAARTLPADFKLGVIDAWRPFHRQQNIYNWMWKNAEEAFPDLPYAQMRRRVCRWVAPTDQKAPPGHCTGAAVDIFPIDLQGEEIDICSPYTRFLAAPTYTLGLSDDAHRARHAMVDAMLAQGFSNCRDEYWHYSYGDAGWAVRLDQPECFYGRIDLEPELYEENEKDWWERIKGRSNPFLEGDSTSVRG